MPEPTPGHYVEDRFDGQDRLHVVPIRVLAVDGERIFVEEDQRTIIPRSLAQFRADLADGIIRREEAA